MHPRAGGASMKLTDKAIPTEFLEMLPEGFLFLNKHGRRFLVVEEVTCPAGCSLMDDAVRDPRRAVHQDADRDRRRRRAHVRRRVLGRAREALRLHSQAGNRESCVPELRSIADRAAGVSGGLLRPMHRPGASRRQQDLRLRAVGMPGTPPSHRRDARIDHRAGR